MKLSITSPSYSIYCFCSQGKTQGFQTVIKSYDGSDPDAIHSYEAELKTYGKLKELQGLHIPRLLFWGPLQESSNPTLVFQNCGTPLSKIPLLTRQHKRAAWRALRGLHSKGAVHGDLSLHHLLWNVEKKRMVLVDLAMATLGVTNNKRFSKEEEVLQRLLEEREQELHAL